MLNMLRVGQIVLRHVDDAKRLEGWSILMRDDHRGFQLQVPFGNINVLSTDEGELGWLWQMLATRGHRTEAAAAIAKTHNAADHLMGVFYLEPTDESRPGTDHRFVYTVYIDNATVRADEDTFAAALFADALSLAEVLDTYEGFIRARHNSDEALAAHETAWPTATAALLDDATPVGMLNILFQCFEENSIHEHVFYHPNADVTLRHRIAASWDRVVAADRPQPYGDPEAPSSAFAHDRTASIAYLREGLT